MNVARSSSAEQQVQSDAVLAVRMQTAVCLHMLLVPAKTPGCAPCSGDIGSFCTAWSAMLPW